MSEPKRATVTGNDTPFREAVRVALTLETTVPAEAVKETEFDPAGTITEAGTARLALLDERFTAVPPAGAAIDSVTVQEVPVLDARLEAVH